MNRQPLQGVARTAAAALAAVMVFAAWQDCLGAAGPQMMQMICCTAGQKDCGPAGEAMKCCQLEPSTKDHLILTESVPPVIQPALIAGPVASWVAPVDGQFRTLAHQNWAHGAHRTPAYILTGSLLI